ncbi:MAG: endonuclease domain-containing protein [Eggerthellaceae bacterium]|jgi:very-short-patch-repair endonuclease|nr:endonuclease domain-containing protein [Eggerthellaceae bacterium]
MGLPRNNALVKNAQELRTNMTPAERRLWFGFLREYPLLFRSQKIVGPYIVDFFCNKVRLSIELDGSQHYEEPHIKRDRLRTNYLEMLEIQELRFPNSYVWENFEGVCEVIHEAAQGRRNDLVSLSLSTLRKKR